MKIPAAYPLALIAIPLVLGLASVADDLSFHPAKDLASKKELRIEAEMRIEDVSASFNGEPIPAEAVEQMTSSEMLLSLAVDVTETFAATADGEPRDLRRTYDAASMAFEFGDEVQESEENDDIRGKTVRFLWDEEEGAFQKSWHESQGDDDLLESIEVDMEVRALLPAKKVAEGDTWEVAGSKLSGVFFPGGFPAPDADAAEGPDLEALQEEFAAQLEAAFAEFKVLCTYKGAREADGVQVGEIAFQYDGKATLELGDMIRRVAEEMGDEVPPFDITASASFEIAGTGVLLWDLASGTLHSYEMSAKPAFDISIEVSGDANGQSIDFSMSGRLAGDVTWELARQ
jgi:hypothetical protein